ncbi:MAG: WecB/TagA/CpsF family glycosyltransferase [Chthonomonas sp.]|nr:WecB/TagA/CpsF family glycosyltransferase [Chthonomonas sp.]
MTPKTDVFICGVPFWNPTYEDFFSWWKSVIQGEDRSSPILCLANPNTINLMLWDEQVYRDLQQCDVWVNDGIGIRIASKWRGVDSPYNFAGTDLMPRLFSEDLPQTAFFFGAKDEVNEQACRIITERHPNLKIVGRMHGYCDWDNDAVPMIADSGADILMAALGQPKQEQFMIRNRDKLNVKVQVTCGGMFDFFSGTKPRAPKIMRATGMEWLYRLSLEPKRMFHRYVLGNPYFLWRALLATKGDKRKLAELSDVSIR